MMNRIRVMNTIVLVTLLIAVPGIGLAKAVFSWVDEHGVVHYTDRAPEGVEAKNLNVKPNAVQSIAARKPKATADTGVDTNAGTGEEPELSFAEQRRRERAERRKQYLEDTRLREANCEAMRMQKAFIEPSPRVLVEDGDGGTRRLEDSERQELLDQANSYLEANCN